MINRSEILQTIAMIDQQHLDIRTITMGISLLDCADTDIDRSCTKVYDKICRLAGNLVRTGEDIEAEFGIPIVNKRVSVTPISLVAAGTGAQSYVPYARALDRAAHEIGVNFLGGFSALVHKGMTEADRVLIASIPEALAETELVCSSVNVGSTRAGINMDAVAEMGRIDVLVNNAGAYPALGVLDVTEDHFNFVVNVNLKGLFFMTQAVVKKSMIPNNYGRIVNISSCDGKNPGRGVAIYSAAKAGVISLTKSFALELADYDINSNAVAAGWVESEQVLSNDRWKDALPSIPSRRLGKLSEIAESVAFLCNDKVSYINGEILDVNGGIIMD